MTTTKVRACSRPFGGGVTPIARCAAETAGFGGQVAEGDREATHKRPRDSVSPEIPCRSVVNLVGMGDGTNAPCVKADTKGVKGKNSDEAGSRQLRALSFCEYMNVTKEGVPIPLPGSFSYAVTDKGIAEMTSMARLHGVARGYGTVERMQCVADGEEALEKAYRDAFPEAIFTNDFMHASGSGEESPRPSSSRKARSPRHPDESLRFLALRSSPRNSNKFGSCRKPYRHPSGFIRMTRTRKRDARHGKTDLRLSVYPKVSVCAVNRRNPKGDDAASGKGRTCSSPLTDDAASIAKRFVRSPRFRASPWFITSQASRSSPSGTNRS